MHLGGGLPDPFSFLVLGRTRAQMCLYKSSCTSCLHPVSFHPSLFLSSLLPLSSPTGRLNWWSSTGKLPPLRPLATSGDGNCLLHAASLYMWGLPDRELVLRQHLYRILTQNQEKNRIRRRWHYQTNLRNQEACGLTFCDDEWDFEWSEILRIATNKPRRRPTTDSLRRYSSLRTHYESLEEVHVFALANVLHRTIIVIADEFLRDMNNEPLAPIYFGGIYLPLECNASACYRSPLMLAYHSSHFSPLVAEKNPSPPKNKLISRFQRMGSTVDTVIPLVVPDGSLLPIQFLHDPKTTSTSETRAKEKSKPGEFPTDLMSALDAYLEVRWVQLNIGSMFESTEHSQPSFPVKVPKVRFPAAVVSSLGEPEYQAVLVTKYLDNAYNRFKEEKVRQAKMAEERAQQEEELRKIRARRPVPCEGLECSMFGTPATNNLCSTCYAKFRATSQSTSDPNSSPSKLSPTRKDTPDMPADEPHPVNALALTDLPGHSPPSDPCKTASSGKLLDERQLLAEPEHQHLSSAPKSKHQLAEELEGHSLSDQKSSHSTVPAAEAENPKASESNQKIASMDPELVNSTNVPSSSMTSAHASSSSCVPPTKSPKRPPPTKPKPLLPAKSKISKQLLPVKSKTSKPQVSKGYSRDHIKPANKVPCKNDTCSFFGAEKSLGYCSQCYKDHHRLATDV